MLSQKFKTYSPQQLDVIRAALKLYRVDGSGVPGVRLSWPQVVSNVEELTDLVVENFAASSDADRAANKLAMRHAGERFRQFVDGVSKKYPEKKRELGKDLPYVVEFLMHPEVRKLNPADLENPETSMDPGRVLGEFLWEREIKPGETVEGLSGTYFTIRAGTDPVHFVALDFVGNPNETCIPVVETVQNLATGEHIQIKHGWAIFTPEQKVIVFQKAILGNDANTYYTGQLEGWGAEPAAWQLLHAGLSLPSLNSSATKVIRRYLDFAKPRGAAFRSALMDEISDDIGELTDLFIRSDDLDFQIKYEYDILKKEVETVEDGGLNFSPPNINGDSDLMKEIDKTDTVENQPELIQALVRCDLEAFTKLVEAGADINEPETGSGQTALHYAAGLVRRPELRVLTARDDLDYLIRDAKGRLPSFLALVNGTDPAMTRFLDRKESKVAAERGVMLNVFDNEPRPGL